MATRKHNPSRERKGAEPLADARGSDRARPWLGMVVLALAAVLAAGPGRARAAGSSRDATPYPSRDRQGAVAVALGRSLALAAQINSDAATTPDDLAARAKAARATAEEDLAEARKRHLDERRALAEQLQQAYDALDAAETRADKATAALADLAEKAKDLEREAALASVQAQRRAHQAADAVGAEVDPTGPVPGIEEAVWAKLDARLEGLAARSRVRIADATVVSRDGREVTVPVLRLGDFAAYACGPDRQSVGLLRDRADGPPLVAGPYLSERGTAALRSAAAGRLAYLPVDVTGSLAERSAGGPRTLAAWLEAGGLFVYPILAVGALGVVLILERMLYLVLTKPRPGLLRDVLAHLEDGNVAAAREAASRTHVPAGRVLLAGADTVGKSEEEREAAMESALLAEAPKLERSLSLLGALAGVAPLLGLLGTVSGMIATFDTISTVGTGNPRLLSGGISEALITTQLGLMIAIPLLLAHAGLERWVQRREAMLEHQAIQVFGIPENGGAAARGPDGAAAGEAAGGAAS